jgi:hypothetical protein
LDRQLYRPSRSAQVANVRFGFKSGHSVIVDACPLYRLSKPLWIPRWHQIPHTHSGYCEARAGKHHCIANGRHQRNIWRAELSKQNSAEAKSECNQRAAGGKYNQSEIA